jgi:hypothetical protein
LNLYVGKEVIMNKKRTFLILSLAMVGLILSTACLWPAGSATPELAGAVTQTWEALSAFSQQDADESPEPVDESQGDEETAPTATTTPGPPIIRVSVDTNCRSGPGLIYEYLGALMTYEEAEVLASSSLPGFWVIENPDSPGTECWVGEQYASIEGDTSGLPERTPPPTATPEESAPSLGSIAGFVYHDGNNNGHFGDPQDSPWINALMILMEGDCPGGPIITTTSTDNNGGYIFPDIPAGLYCVDTNNSIFIPADYEIDLDEGQHVVGINFRTTP